MAFTSAEESLGVLGYGSVGSAILRRWLNLLILILAAYVTTSVFNLVDLVTRQGFPPKPADLAHALSLDVVDRVVSQNTVLFVLVTSIVLVAVPALSIIERLRINLMVHSYEQALSQFREQRLAEQGAQGNTEAAAMEAAAGEWAQQMLGMDAPQRLARLKLIEEWFTYDELLMSWTKVFVEKKQFSASVWSSFSSQMLQNVFLVGLGAIIALLAQK